MIVELMAYTIAVSLLVGLAALAIDVAAGLAGMPRRWVWVGAMVISLAGAVTAEQRTDAPRAPSVGIPSTVIAITRSAVQSRPFPPPSVGTPVQRVRGLVHLTVAAQVERYAKWSWLGASSLLFGAYIAGALRLMRARRNWARRSIGNYKILVSEDIGPAVFGLFRPAIVVPRWLLDEALATRDAALSHEYQHIAARDPALLLVALLLLALTPWNLPWWWQLRRLKLAIEVDCDTRVLGAGVDRRVYADVLLRINQYAGKMPVGAVAIVGRASQTERRIRAMMTTRPRHWRLWFLGIAAVAIPILVVAAELNPPSSAPVSEQRVYLGIGLADLDVNAGAASVIAVRHGAIVTYVNPGSVADHAGLKRGDLVIEFGDTSIISARTLATAVAQTGPDARVPLVIKRGSMNQRLMADFSSAPPPQPQSAQVVDTSDWDSLRDAQLVISKPQLRDELVRMAKLDELQQLMQSATTQIKLAPDTSTVGKGVRMEPGSEQANIRRLREVIAQYGWPTVSMVGVRGATAAGLIASMAHDDSAFQAEVLTLMQPLLRRGEVPAMYYAGLYDAVHTPQRYGMLFECVNGKNTPSKPVEDPLHLEERRAALGLAKIPQFCISATSAKGIG